jgi:hypothetical protein
LALPRPCNVNGMHNPLLTNYFPPTLFSLTRFPIYERSNFFRKLQGSG